jgi:hypothetical protein
LPRALFYEDPAQNLFINLPAGEAVRLDGKMAEGLVRYRGYPLADEERVFVQQQFMMQLFRQVLTREAIMSNPLSLAGIALRNVDTDIGIALVNYVPFISNLGPDRIFTYTLPGSGAYVGPVSYFLPDPAKIPSVVNEVFYTSFNPQESTGPPPSANLNISVLNGSRYAGLASNIADVLRLSGYNVSNVGNYGGNQENRTRILVRREGTGTDLLPYFKNAVIMVDTTIPPQFDIVIIVGRGER